MRVLVTRPATLAKGLCEQVKALGAIAEPFPVIDIHPTPYQSALQLAIETLKTTDIAIFVSRSAVHFTMPAIQLRWHSPPPSTLSTLWAAIGAGTAEALKSHGISTVLFPEKPPYESESLLATEALQSVAGKKILIFRGNGGRSLLNQVLQERGAVVQSVEAYQRCLPTINLLDELIKWNYNPINVIVTTSAECLNNLVLLVGKDSDWLKEVPIVVVGSRMYKLAEQLKFKRPLLATGADDASIIKVLTKLKDNLV